MYKKYGDDPYTCNGVARVAYLLLGFVLPARTLCRSCMLPYLCLVHDLILISPYVDVRLAVH